MDTLGIVDESDGHCSLLIDYSPLKIHVLTNNVHVFGWKFYLCVSLCHIRHHCLPVWSRIQMDMWNEPVSTHAHVDLITAIVPVCLQNTYAHVLHDAQVKYFFIKSDIYKCDNYVFTIYVITLEPFILLWWFLSQHVALFRTQNIVPHWTHSLHGNMVKS